MAKINWTPYLIIYYLVGLVGLIIPESRSLFTAAVPFTLLMSTALLFLVHGSFSLRNLAAMLLIFLLGFFVEVAGVATGLIFGDYHYGATLGPKVFDTPLLIGINWLMLIYSSLRISGRFIEQPYFRAIITAVLMVIYDIALEPSAIYLDMWSWGGGAIPLQNYLAWFFISLVLALLGNWLGLASRKNKVAAPLFFIQLLFFIAIDIWIIIERIWVSS